MTLRIPTSYLDLVSSYHYLFLLPTYSYCTCTSQQLDLAFTDSTVFVVKSSIYFLTLISTMGVRWANADFSK